MGEALSLRLLRRVSVPGWTVQEVAHELGPWASMLVRHAQHKAGQKPTLRGHFIDIAPTNVAVHQGQVEAYSLEWDLARDVPLGWVLLRALRSQ